MASVSTANSAVLVWASYCPHAFGWPHLAASARTQSLVCLFPIWILVAPPPSSPRFGFSGHWACPLKQHLNLTFKSPLHLSRYRLQTRVTFFTTQPTPLRSTTPLPLSYPSLYFPKIPIIKRHIRYRSVGFRNLHPTTALTNYTPHTQHRPCHIQHTPPRVSALHFPVCFLFCASHCCH